MTAHARHQLDTSAEHLRDMIRDLTRTTNHREQLNRAPAAGGSLAHFTKVPPLLVQLQTADPTSEQGARSRSAYESRPALAIEALDTLARIDLAAARWIRDLGEDDPSSTVACVSLLGGLVASANRCHAPRAIVDRQTRKVLCCTWHAIEQDVRTWWTQARITTGWEALAWRPDNTCPLCGERRTLRIRLEERIGLCTNCHETWTPTGEPGYQTLANHIRAEADERGSRRTAVGPCWCPWPLSSAQEAWRGRLFGICPRCGSASCRHAVRSKPKRSA